MIPPDSLLVGAEAAAGGAPEDMDPLRLLGLEDAPAIAPGPSAASLAYNSPLSQHYRPPAASAPPPAAPAAPARAVPGQAGGHFIPIDYDPFAPEETAAPKGPPRTVAIPTPPPQAALSTNAPVSAPPPRRSATAPASPANDAMRFVPRQGVPAGAAVPAAGVAVPRSAPATTVEGPPAAASTPLAASTPAGAPTPAVMPGAPQGARRTRGEAPGDLEFAALLAAAGIEAVATPELSQKFGQILRVVVAGLMDVLRARGKIKDEFRMRMTTFKQEDNNPLKFSANVEDALHNLLVKRNAAYLGPVEAFEDAFQELRNHQMAMLAGMRVAYDAMLAEFDPARLQDEFDKHVKAGSFLSGPAKLRYWELYRNRFHDMVKDADSSFRHLFGDEFAKAYEEQLVRLKTLSRADRR
jgi:type VI secretion system FHA domain protein